MASKQQQELHKENLSRIVQCLRVSKSLTRKEVAEKTALSWGCTSESLSYLIEQGYVMEERQTDRLGKGRVPLILKLRGDFCFLGVDVNEIGLSARAVNLYGAPMETWTSSLSGTDPLSICRSILCFLEEILQSRSGILGIGLAMQGIHNKEQDCWLFPTARGRIALPIRQFLQEHLTLPFCLEHDPNCALLAESMGEETRNLLLIRLDRGIGAALYQDAQCFRNGLLELGETVIDRDGTRLHQIASLSAWEENRELSQTAFFHRAGHALGTALGNLCHCLFVDEIILCGSMLSYADDFLPALRDSLLETISHPPTIRLAKRADPALGAARLAAERYIY